jgi:hypothetical protein
VIAEGHTQVRPLSLPPEGYSPSLADMRRPAPMRADARRCAPVDAIFRLNERVDPATTDAIAHGAHLALWAMFHANNKASENTTGGGEGFCAFLPHRRLWRFHLLLTGYDVLEGVMNHRLN